MSRRGRWAKVHTMPRVAALAFGGGGDLAMRQGRFRVLTGACLARAGAKGQAARNARAYAGLAPQTGRYDPSTFGASFWVTQATLFAATANLPDRRLSSRFAP